jgi:hypothetical protein
MTVHKAKGLEFPVVVLADMTAKLRNERADRLIDRTHNACYLRLGRWTPIELATNEALEVARDEAEGVRVAYVAATRARDLLVVPAVGDVAWEGGWTGPLNTAIHPEPQARKAVSAVAPGCPPFTSDSVWRRPDNDPSNSTTVCPGEHTFAGADGPYRVVWWDPHTLDLGVEGSIGIRRETLIMKDVPESVVADGLRDYEQWRTLREDAIAKGSTMSLSVRTATEWAASGEAGPTVARPGVEVAPVQRGLFDEEGSAIRGPAEAALRGPQGGPEPGRRAGHHGEAGNDDEAGHHDQAGLHSAVAIVDARGRERPGGARFGEMVHATLAASPLDSDRSAVEAIASVQGRILAAPADEISAAVDTVERVLAHDLLARARAADARDACRRETPVTCLLPGGVIVEGIVDLAFEEHGAWTVVDYKTDRELAASGEDRYRRQVALYASAIAQATGQPATGVLVRV